MLSSSYRYCLILKFQVKHMIINFSTFPFVREEYAPHTLILFGLFSHEFCFVSSTPADNAIIQVGIN